jgi:hypothetical protein
LVVGTALVGERVVETEPVLTSKHGGRVYEECADDVPLDV